MVRSVAADVRPEFFFERAVEALDFPLGLRVLWSAVAGRMPARTSQPSRQVKPTRLFLAVEKALSQSNASGRPASPKTSQRISGVVAKVMSKQERRAKR